jgi:hypothetical protein
MKAIAGGKRSRRATISRAGTGHHGKTRNSCCYSIAMNAFSFGLAPWDPGLAAGPELDFVERSARCRNALRDLERVDCPMQLQWVDPFTMGDDPACDRNLSG